ERIVLEGLSVQDVVEVMSAAAGHEMDEVGTQLAAEIVDETGGNPFFVGEILHHLTESGALTRGSDGRWRLTTSIAELGLPERVGWFHFAQALINHTLYEHLSATRRARMHRRVAEALEDLCGGDPGERLSALAYHWSLATVSVDSWKAIGYAAQAGERALQELAPDEALRWFNQALELLGPAAGDSSERCALLIGSGEAQRHLGEPAFRETLLEATG